MVLDFNEWCTPRGETITDDPLALRVVELEGLASELLSVGHEVMITRREGANDTPCLVINNQVGGEKNPTNDMVRGSGANSIVLGNANKA